jgi:hypothetical protein
LLFGVHTAWIAPDPSGATFVSFAGFGNLRRILGREIDDGIDMFEWNGILAASAQTDANHQQTK